MKKFIIIGNGNAVTDKDIFPYIKENIIWLGASKGICGKFYFLASKDYDNKHNLTIDGKKVAQVNNACWFTNVEHKKHHTPLDLYKKYSNEYQKYDNYDAIDSRTEEIPMDYNGLIGVPISFLDKYCPEQFEIVDLINRYMIFDYFGVNEDVRKRHSHCANINGKAAYSRILIRKRTEKEDQE